MKNNSKFSLSFGGTLREGTGQATRTAKRYVYVLTSLSKKQRELLEQDIADWDPANYMSERRSEGRPCPIALGVGGEILYFSSKKISERDIKSSFVTRYEDYEGLLRFGLQTPMDERDERAREYTEFKAKHPELTQQEILHFLYGA